VVSNPLEQIKVLVLPKKEMVKLQMKRHDRIQNIDMMIKTQAQQSDSIPESMQHACQQKSNNKTQQITI
jgi:hypothetical protein